MSIEVVDELLLIYLYTSCVIETKEFGLYDV
jgi:hypothetical protein